MYVCVCMQFGIYSNKIKYDGIQGYQQINKWIRCERERTKSTENSF